MKLKFFFFILTVFLCSISYAVDSTIEITGPQTMGMSMFRAHWDMPIQLNENGQVKIVDSELKERGGTAIWGKDGGPIAFDALNRSLLVRFPDAAEKIAVELKKGLQIKKVEIILPFRDEELWAVGSDNNISAEGYEIRKNWDCDKIYRAIRPEWHAIGYSLRKPWIADPEKGPTFNASVNGACYWTKYGAADTKNDRFPMEFGPGEVSYKNPEGRLDVTAALNDSVFGKSTGERLRTFADCGTLIRKWETYDHRYFTGAYEWATATGGRAILVNNPRLVVTFAEGKIELGDLPPPADISAQKGGQATAVIPTLAQVKEIAAKFAAKPSWMPDWQWQRVQELLVWEDPKKAGQPFWFQYLPSHIIGNIYARQKKDNLDADGISYAVYCAWVDKAIGRMPRGWSGFESAREMTQWYVYGQALPSPAQDAIKRYWTAWLQPDRETATSDKQCDINCLDGTLVHPMVQDDRVGKGPGPDPLKGIFDNYWSKTGDWHGNKSFFRSGFCYRMSTQNFNTTSSIGALLGGSMIGSERAITDGRNGINVWLMQQYTWQDGSGQENIDHYYFPVSVTGDKSLADFPTEPIDRLMGQSLITKNLEELISTYHPGLRSFVSGSSRTHLEYLIAKQDGLQFIMHTLSKSGALRDREVKEFPGKLNTIGHEVPPAQIAAQTLVQPWAPEWVVPMVDDKVLPFYARYTGWSNTFRTVYLGRNYGLASNQTLHNMAPRIHAMAQWRREAKQAGSAIDLGTLDLRFGDNETRFNNDGPGNISQRGSHSVLQHKNKLIFISSPKTSNNGFLGENDRKDILSMQTSIGLFTLQDKPTWTIYVDGQKVESLPFTCKQGQKITIKDGVTYLGIIPLDATNLGRNAEVVIEEGKIQPDAFHPDMIKVSLVINSYNYKSLTPFPNDPAKWIEAGKAYGGYAVELGDQSEYADFAKFQKHVADTKLQQNFDAASNAFNVNYISGGDTMEAGIVTYVPNGNPPTGEQGTPKLTLAKINGKDSCLPTGIERDTPYCQQGYPHLEKEGAVLDIESGCKGFLLVEPKAGVYCAWNPMTDISAMSFSPPGGMTISADGRLGICRMLARPKENRLEIDHYFSGKQADDPSAARAILIFGAAKQPIIFFNGNEVKEKLATVMADGKSALVLPLSKDKPLRDPAAMDKMYKSLASLTKLLPDPEKIYLSNIETCGSFDTKEDSAELDKKVIASAETDAADRKSKDIQWRRHAAGNSSPYANRVESGSPYPPRVCDPAGGGEWTPRYAKDDYDSPVPRIFYARTVFMAEAATSVNLCAWVQNLPSGWTLDEMSIWLNGVELMKPKAEAYVKKIDLKEGRNVLVIKCRQVKKAVNGSAFYVRIGDPVFGKPTVRGVSYQTAKGFAPVNPEVK